MKILILIGIVFALMITVAILNPEPKYKCIDGKRYFIQRDSGVGINTSNGGVMIIPQKSYMYVDNNCTKGE